MIPTSFKMDVLAENGTPFRVVFLPFGNKFSDKPQVEFFDLRYNFTENGQFVTRYNHETLLERDRFAGLDLMMGEPSWQVDGDTMSIVLKWLNSFEVVPAS